MARTVLIWLVIATLTSADLVVFVKCVPPLCQVWGTDRLWMSTLFLGLVIWVESLSNVWKAALRIWNPLLYLTTGVALPVRLLPSEQGGEENV